MTPVSTSWSIRRDTVVAATPVWEATSRALARPSRSRAFTTCLSISSTIARRSDGLGTGLARSDLVGVVDREDEDLAVALLARVGAVGDGFDHVVGGDVGDDSLDFDLLVEVDDVLLAAPLALLGGLGAPTGDVRHCQRGRADLRERLFHVAELVGTDHCNDHLDVGFISHPWNLELLRCLR